jgi:hypothetical protein
MVVVALMYFDDSFCAVVKFNLIFHKFANVSDTVLYSTPILNLGDFE